MKFCPKCGAALSTRFEGGRERVSCGVCKYIFFGEFSIGVGGVVIHDGKALLIRRGEEPNRGHWQIPGGYVEHDEEFDAAVVREVHEEAGIHARVVDVLGVRNSLGSPSTNVYVIFRLELVEGVPSANGVDATGAGFFTLDEIERMEKVQGLSKWAIGAALLGQSGFERVEGAAVSRPGYVLYGMTGR